MNDHPAWAVNIEVHVDLHRACDAVGANCDQREFVSALFNHPGMTEMQAGRLLQWSPQRTENVVRSLRPDRAVGGRLRAFLGAYQRRDENKSEIAVRKIADSAA